MRKFTSSLKSASGFTLIELVIVIAILGMLAAIVVQKLDTVPDKADDVINAENLKELNTFIQIHYTNTGKVPDALDCLTDDTGNQVAGPWDQTFPNLLSFSGTADQQVIQALDIMGLTQVHQEGIKPTPIVSGMTLATINAAGAPDQYMKVMGELVDLNSRSLYVFGLGPYFNSRSDNSLANLPRCPLVKENNDIGPQYDYYLLLVDLTDLTNPKYLGFVDPTFEAAFTHIGQ